MHASAPGQRIQTRRPGFGKASALLLILVASSGCVTHPVPLPEPAPTIPTPTHPTISYANNATDCFRAFNAIFVDRVHAQTFLPPGFVAAESSRFFSQTEVPAGRGVLVVSITRCRLSEWQAKAYDEAMAGIFVNPPKVGGVGQTGEHFYELARAFEDGPVGSTLTSLGWPRLGEAVRTTYDAAPAHSATASITDSNGTVFSMSLPAAPAMDSFPAHVRWWHKTPTGLGFFEYQFTVAGQLGWGTCQARAGTAPARVTGVTPCQALVMVGPPFDVKGHFEHVEGLNVDA